MIVLDSSAWIEYDRATGSRVDQRVIRLIDEDGPVAVTEPVVAEVLMGARDDAAERDLRRLLARCTLLPFDAAVDFDGAVRVYRRCRRAGITPRGLVDCMIATVALRNGASVLAADRDLDQICAVIGVPLDGVGRDD